MSIGDIVGRLVSYRLWRRERAPASHDRWIRTRSSSSIHWPTTIHSSPKQQEPLASNDVHVNLATPLALLRKPAGHEHVIGCYGPRRVSTDARAIGATGKWDHFAGSSRIANAAGLGARANRTVVRAAARLRVIDGALTPPKSPPLEKPTLHPVEASAPGNPGGGGGGIGGPPDVDGGTELSGGSLTGGGGRKEGAESVIPAPVAASSPPCPPGAPSTGSPLLAPHADPYSNATSPNSHSTGCVPHGASGTGGAPCTATTSETCGSTTYTVVCSCPDGSCACFGPTTHVVSFTGCPSCPGGVGSPANPGAMFDLCGFPH
jgi:hypothetical protein